MASFEFMSHRDEFLRLDDEQLLARCVLRPFQGSGPGGQHRNKTNTGIELLLTPFNLAIHCCDDRSTQVNRQHALQRLRLRLAVTERIDPPPSPSLAFPGTHGHVSSTNPGFALFIADVLDRIESQHGEIRPAAESWSLSPSALIRILFQEKPILEAVQALRRKWEKPLLKG